MAHKGEVLLCLVRDYGTIDVKYIKSVFLEMQRVYLTERRKAILKAVVEDYILHGQPVGSKTLVGLHGLHYSPATIRAEMAALEDMGYLTHPHTSAGRVPTEIGYRYYVDHLLTIPPVSNQEMENLSQAISSRGEDLRQLLVEVCRLISTITTYASIALTPHFQQLILKRLHFVPISSRASLVIIVTSAKIIQSSLAEVPEEITEEQLEELSRILSRHIDGKTPWEALQIIQVLREGSLRQFAFLLGQIHSFIHEVFLFEQRERLIVEGEENVLLSPELQDLNKLRMLISTLDRRFLLQEFLERRLTSKNLQVIIGGENEFFEMRDLSLLAMPFETSSYNWGALGLVGPMRMDYGKAIRTLSCVTSILERNLQREGI